MIALVITTALGGLYGAATAAVNGDDAVAGFFIGMLSGAILGVGTAIAGISAISSIAIKISITFISGAIAGFTSDTLNQIANDGYVKDWSSALISSLEYGCLNTLNFGLCSIGATDSVLENVLLNLIFGNETSLIGFAIDVIKNKFSDNEENSKEELASYVFER